MKRLRHNYSNYDFVVYDQDDNVLGYYSNLKDLSSQLNINLYTLYSVLCRNTRLIYNNSYYKIYKFKKDFVENKG